MMGAGSERACTTLTEPTEEAVVPSALASLSLAYRLFFWTQNWVLALVGTFGVLLPLFPFIALAVLWDSPGPLFYRQVRLGKNKVPFTVLKFRTMVVDAEPNGAQWAVPNDDRVTRIGSFLRKFRFDELPQFINVLCGDMAVIGPRPERPEFVETLERTIPEYAQRFVVKPGITGLAQVFYKYGNTVADTETKLRYDLEWVQKRSIGLDVYILLRTVYVAVCGIGAL